MKNFFIYFILMGAVLVGLASCKSSSGLSGRASAEVADAMAAVEVVMGNRPDFETFTSRLKLTVPFNGESSFNGTLKIKKDALIQISLQVPLIRIEAARIEIANDYITVIDRINKRYVHVPVSELKSYLKTDLDYYTLQALFINSVFLPGKRGVEPGDISRFSVEEVTGEDIRLFRKEKGLLYLFDVDSRKAELTASQIRAASAPYGLLWSYEEFSPLAGKSFPTVMGINLDTGDRTSRVKMELTRLSTDKEEINPVEIPAKYSKVELDELIKQLLKI